MKSVRDNITRMRQGDLVKPVLVGIVGIVALAAITCEAFAACGERGGPGYRGPDGKCVGWAELGRKCGAPPSLRCTPELAHPKAPDGAERGRGLEKLKEDAHAGK